MKTPRDPWRVACTAALLAAVITGWPTAGWCKVVELQPAGDTAVSTPRGSGPTGLNFRSLDGDDPQTSVALDGLPAGKLQWVSRAADSLRWFEVNVLDRIASRWRGLTVHGHGGFSFGVPGAAVLLMADLFASGKDAHCKSHLNGGVSLSLPFFGASTYVREPVLGDKAAKERETRDPPKTMFGRIWRAFSDRSSGGPILGIVGFNTRHRGHGPPYVWFFLPHVGGFAVGRDGDRGYLELDIIVNPLSPLSPYVGLTVSHPWLFSKPVWLNNKVMALLNTTERWSNNFEGFCKARYDQTAAFRHACKTRASTFANHARERWSAAKSRFVVPTPTFNPI